MSEESLRKARLRTLEGQPATSRVMPVNAAV